MGIALAQYQAWDDTVSRDEADLVDDTTSWEETAGAEVLFNYLFNTTSTLKTYEGLGIFESNPITLPACLVNTTMVSWLADVPTGASLSVKVALSTDGGITWTDWQTVNNNSPIPGITAGTYLSDGYKLKVRFDMSTTNYGVRPSVSSFTVRLNSRTILRLYANGSLKIAGTLLEGVPEEF